MRNDQADALRILREQRTAAAPARCRCRRARSRLLLLVVETSGSHRTWTSSPPLRRRDSEPPRGQGSTDDRPLPPRPRQFDRQRISSSKRLRPAPAARATTRRRALLSFVSPVVSRFSPPPPHPTPECPR